MLGSFFIIQRSRFLQLFLAQLEKGQNLGTFDYREWGENYSLDFWGNYEEAMTQIERAKQELAYYNQQPDEYVDENEYARLSALASLTIDVDISMDTSKVATGVPYTITLTVNGHTLTKKGNDTVFPQDFVQLIRRTYCWSKCCDT